MLGWFVTEKELTSSFVQHFLTISTTVLLVCKNICARYSSCLSGPTYAKLGQTYFCLCFCFKGYEHIVGWGRAWAGWGEEVVIATLQQGENILIPFFRDFFFMVCSQHLS